MSYIKKEELLKQLDESGRECEKMIKGSCRASGKSFAHGMMQALAIVYAFVENQPSKDIVTCAECVHGVEVGPSLYKCLDCDWIGDDDFWCKEGKRREE